MLVYVLSVFAVVCFSWYLLCLIFINWCRFFNLSANSSGLFLLYVETYAKGCSFLYFLGVCILSANLNHLIICIVWFPSGGSLHVILFIGFIRYFVRKYIAEYIYIYIYTCKWIHTYVYIYIYIERERKICMYINMYEQEYIYIYICCPVGW